MRILADENIPLADAFFASLGELCRVPGRALAPAVLKDADVLLVRSVTQVDRPLLEGSKVRFVGTCTIGTDHLDLDYLRERHIAFASAPGCNARAVVDYVLSSLLVLAERRGVALRERRYGVVGCGAVGGLLVALLKALGCSVWQCDPPRQAAEGGEFVHLDKILAECDVISLHTPLNASTRHLIGANQLAQMRPHTWLINSSRGAVVDNLALLTAREDLALVLDVWEGEPQVCTELAARCTIATPHIAGYSLDGRLRGTAQIYQALCEHLGLAPRVQLQALLPAPWLAGLHLHGNCPPDWALATLCRAVYDVRRDDAAFRLSLRGNALERRAAFDALRKHYPERREISSLAVRAQAEVSAELAQVLAALGVAYKKA
ncbi:erythronate-4-phosphate dehydrogenase [Ventosimonas gracilis]|uniref:Erythronate-4-phosphate dehydrogenase n=1 Tax=Ventosimonas gracilis TaxID=1680762 RepID=A0A139SPB5_9GAMM|nr:4-phosphoerythronate dehydrogenase PdxB [Ventosimonas gracilis]KXU36397.1 erythronate-4-phosphate dehydrogenase [Ventosimonas gracilis]